MAEVATSGQHRPSYSVGNILSAQQSVAAVPHIEMTPNPEFSFPMLPPSDQAPRTRSLRPHGRPVSMNVGGHVPAAATRHKRAATQQLPSFTFNSTNHTGLQAEQPTLLPAEPIATTPSRGGHRRNVSEFVGGVGMNSAISSSPTRSSTLETPGFSRGHKHRRSAAASSHDLSSIMSQPEAQPRLSSSLPSTPLQHPANMPDTFGGLHQPNNDASGTDPFGPPSEHIPGRPPSRRQVGFSENVEYIPRPLSTISSETESSLNTMRGHSVNNSISSMLSLSTPSPSAPRARAISLETTPEDEPKLLTKSSANIGKRVEREGEWLRHGSSGALDRPATASEVPLQSLTFVTANAPARVGFNQRKKHSASRSLGFDRRKSEPAMGLHASEPSRLSALSLQESAHSSVASPDEDDAAANRRSSTRKIKDWAVAKIARRARPRSEVLVPRPSTYHEAQRSVAETDLDAVFNMDNDLDVVHDRVLMPELQLGMNVPVHGTQSNHRTRNSEEGAMLDLDDALGRPRTPTQQGFRRTRKALHSDRGTLDFMGPGAHYQPMHHRTASAPVLMAFDQPRTSSPQQSALAVFEEEEEEQMRDMSLVQDPTRSATDEESATGVSIVDQDASIARLTQASSLDEGLGIQRSEWDLGPPACVPTGSRLSTPVVERRASSIIEQTIIEETSPVDTVAIVHAQEHWDDMDIRAHSLTKSSDSSEAPTLMAVPTGLLSVTDQSPALTTSEASHSSAFSSPDFTRRQSSFDNSRVGTSASSIADTRTVSSCTTGEPQQDHRTSVDDVPSLTSSRSTMISTMHANSSRRDVTGLRTPSLTSGSLDTAAAESRRRKRASIQSLSQLVGGTFGPRPAGINDSRPSTAATETGLSQAPKKREHRLKKLMFWKSKRQFSTSTII